VFRRRPPRPSYPALPAFGEVVELVEAAKRELVAAVPSPRGVPARSPADALLAFEQGLRDAEARMEGWRGSDVEDAWRACRDGLGESLRRADRLRLDPPVLDYESLVTVLGDLLAPLEAFEEAERRLGRA
jgi:hypothetical protein